MAVYPLRHPEASAINSQYSHLYHQKQWGENTLVPIIAIRSFVMSDNTRPRGHARSGDAPHNSQSSHGGQGNQGGKSGNGNGRGSRRRRRGRSRNNRGGQNVSNNGSSQDGSASPAKANDQASPAQKNAGGGSTSSATKPSSPKPGPRRNAAPQPERESGAGSRNQNDRGSTTGGNRSRRRGRGGANSNRTAGGNTRRGRSSQRRKATKPRHTQYQGSKMETRDETSAGGLVVSGLAEAVRDDGTVALDRIYVALIGRLDRRGRLLWSMPKGHVEPGEDIAATAEREVWEETGIHGEVFAELGVIDYWFVSEGIRIHKTVHHHLLRYIDGDLNDEDPEVTEVSWIPASALIEHFAYADERKLARIAHDLLPEVARKEHAEGRITPR